MSEWTKGVVTGLVIGVVFVVLVFFSGRGAVAEIEREMNRTIAQQRAQITALQGENAQCTQAFKGMVRRNYELEVAIRQHQNEMPAQLLAVLAKLLL